MTNPSEEHLRAFTDQARRDDAAETRRREQWLRRQAEEDGTFHGLLVDLTERRAALAVHTSAGRVVRGHPVVLGLDFVAIAGPQQGTTLVPLAMVVGVSPEPGSAPSVGDRPEATAATFAGALADLATDRPHVSIHTGPAGSTAGTLWSTGRDFATVRSSSGDLYVPFAAVNDLTWR